MQLIERQQRLYIRAHPWVFWACLGFMFIAGIGLVAPSLLLTSPAASVLPGWLRAFFYAAYALGAGLSVLGQLRGLAKLEAAGMMLLATGFVVQMACGVYLLSGLYPLPKVLVSNSTLGFFAVGSYLRARFLTEYGYPARITQDARRDG
jgi:hypothetical protein